jgi:hypothetical protein
MMIIATLVVPSKEERIIFFRKLRDSAKRSIIREDVQFITQYQLQQIACQLTFKVFSLKMYQQFHIYAIRVEQLKAFCVCIDEKYKTVLVHSKTCLLSLLPALERLIY